MTLSHVTNDPVHRFGEASHVLGIESSHGDTTIIRHVRVVLFFENLDLVGYITWLSRTRLAI